MLMIYIIWYRDYYTRISRIIHSLNEIATEYDNVYLKKTSGDMETDLNDKGKFSRIVSKEEVERNGRT